MHRHCAWGQYHTCGEKTPTINYTPVVVVVKTWIKIDLACLSYFLLNKLVHQLLLPSGLRRRRLQTFLLPGGCVFKALIDKRTIFV